MLGGVDELAILDVSKNVNSMESDILHWAKQNHYLKKDVSTSAKKLITPKKDISENSFTFSKIIIDLDILSDIISLTGICPECKKERIKLLFEI